MNKEEYNHRRCWLCLLLLEETAQEYLQINWAILAGQVHLLLIILCNIRAQSEDAKAINMYCIF